MDLKELGAAMTEALALRGMIDALDEKIGVISAQLDVDKKEVARLENLLRGVGQEEATKKALFDDKEKKRVELAKRLALLKEHGVVLPLQERFGARQVSL